MGWLAVGVVLVTADLPAKQDAGGSGWMPVLELRVVSAYPDGTRPGSFGQWKLAGGAAPIAATVWSGPNLCSIGIGGAGTRAVMLGGGSDIATRTPASANVWSMNGDYLGEKDGRYSVRLTTRFERADGQNSSASATQTLSLREGDSLILDALRGVVDASCPVHTVTLEARLVMQAGPALTRAQYVADLWLVRTNDGGERREHLVTNLDGSAAVPFRFSRLTIPVSTPAAKEANATVWTQVLGMLRARPQPDGRIELDLDTDSQVFGVANPDSVSLPTATRRKTLRLKPDETTAIDFPTPVGFVNLTVGSGSERRPVRLYYEPLFKGQKIQLLVRLQAVP